MNWHRILAGSPAHRAELIAAGIFVAIWFVMDAAQWIDWAWLKFNPPAAISCLTLPSAPLAPGYFCGSQNCSIPLTQNNGAVQ